MKLAIDLECHITVYTERCQPTTLPEAVSLVFIAVGNRLMMASSHWPGEMAVELLPSWNVCTQRITRCVVRHFLEKSMERYS